MKIGIDARFYGSEHTGLGRYTTNFISELTKLKSDYTFFIFLRNKYYRKVVLPDNFHKVSFEVSHYSAQEQIALPITIKKHYLDLFHSLHLNAPYFAPCPLILTVHDLIKNSFNDYSTTTRSKLVFGLKRLGYLALVRKIMNSSTRIITPSQYVRSEIISTYSVDPAKIDAIYEAPDPIFITRPEIKPKKDYFLYVGNSYPHKNLSTLLHAFSSISGEFEDIQLILVTKMNAFLNRELASVKKEVLRKIKIVEDLKDTEMVNYYDQAIATVIPSLMEGFGLVGIESLARKTPVIASDIPVFREVYEDNAIYFPPTSVTSLRDKMRECLLRGHKASLPRNKYSWESLAKRILEVYDEISADIRQA